MREEGLHIEKQFELSYGDAKFCVSTPSISTSWLLQWMVVLPDGTMRKLYKQYLKSFCTISYNHI